ncbi:MAG TPA: hypothetical protein VEQ16_10045 [Acidocella sp.]|jgi:hypothetical protein|nr:hypothetical protein [Acidocella sp.]
MPGSYLRGAFVSFTETFPLPIPNVVIFQYNPETMTHTWTPAQTGGAAATGAAAHAPASAAGGSTAQPADGASNPLAVTGPPGEAFSFTLMLDANDMIADGNAASVGLAKVSGVYTRLAALEMLLFPTDNSGGGLIGSISSALGITGGSTGPSTPIPAQQLPTVLFIWGPGRILPVKLTSLTTTEKLFDNVLLNPIHAEVSVGLKVLTPQELQYVDGPLGDLANTAYSVSKTLREALALANLANGVGDIIGMLPI